MNISLLIRNSYAKLQIERITDKTEILKTQIKTGKIVPEIQNPDIRELIEGNYRIIYRIVNKERVDIHSSFGS